jgi:hypothetical protein
MEIGALHRRVPDVTVIEYAAEADSEKTIANVATPSAVGTEELAEDELELRKQRRIVIYIDDQPRRAVTTIELLSPSNKEVNSIGQLRYLEKRNSALHGGLQWVEIDLLRGGQRPTIPIAHESSLYSCYLAIATQAGWEHRVYGWGLRDRLPNLPIPLLGMDHAVLDLGRCFREAYDAAAADTEAGYEKAPPLPPLSGEDERWIDQLLASRGLR